MKNFFAICHLSFIARRRGATAILLAVLMLSVMLLIGSGVSALIINQLRMSINAGQSVLSFYAADAGAERCLYDMRKDTGQGCDGTGASRAQTLDNNSNYSAQKVNNTTIRSSGFFGETSRRLELSW